MIQILTGEEREVVVGQPTIIAAEITDAAGNLVARTPVRFRTDEPDAVDMDGGGRPYVMTKTNSRGIAEVRSVTVLAAGDVEVEVVWGVETKTITLKATDTGVVTTPGGGAVITGAGGGTPIIVMPPPPTPVVAPAPRGPRVIVINTGRR